MSQRSKKTITKIKKEDALQQMVRFPVTKTTAVASKAKSKTTKSKAQSEVVVWPGLSVSTRSKAVQFPTASASLSPPPFYNERVRWSSTPLPAERNNPYSQNSAMLSFIHQPVKHYGSNGNRGGHVSFPHGGLNAEYTSLSSSSSSGTDSQASFKLQLYPPPSPSHDMPDESMSTGSTFTGGIWKSTSSYARMVFQPNKIQSTSMTVLGAAASLRSKTRAKKTDPRDKTMCGSRGSVTATKETKPSRLCKKKITWTQLRPIRARPRLVSFRAKNGCNVRKRKRAGAFPVGDGCVKISLKKRLQENRAARKTPADWYDLIKVVGKGSYGQVYKARHKETGHLVAIKKFFQSENEPMIKKFSSREVNLLKSLKHENLVNLIQHFTVDNKMHLVFEYCERTLLQELKAHPSGLSQYSARRIIMQVFCALRYCHKNKCIHRDVKPENILITQKGIVKLCDFGLARNMVGLDEDCTQYVATRWYRAPELLVGEHPYGPGVDVWAAGCVLFEILTGKALWPGSSDLDQLIRIRETLGELVPDHMLIFNMNTWGQRAVLKRIQQTVPLRARLPKWIGHATVAFLKKCLDKNPTTRPSCDKLLRDFSYFGIMTRFLFKKKPPKQIVQVQKQERTCSVMHPPARYISIWERQANLTKAMTLFTKKESKNERKKKSIALFNWNTIYSSRFRELAKRV